MSERESFRRAMEAIEDAVREWDELIARVERVRKELLDLETLWKGLEAHDA